MTLAAEQTVTLIGMPGSGKSTIGQLLADKLGRPFIDGDAVIESQEGRPLQEIIDTEGVEAFRVIEERCLCELDAPGAVIAPGGSVVYYPKAVEHLRGSGPVIALEMSIEGLQERIGNMESRGIVFAPGQTFADLYNERTPLYRRFAEFTVECDGQTPEQTLHAVLTVLGKD